MRLALLACAVATAIAASAPVARAQTCTGTATTVNSVAPSPINFGTVTDAQMLGSYVDLPVTVTTASFIGFGAATVKLCVLSTDPNMGASTPPGYIKPLADLRVGPSGAPIAISQSYTYLAQQTVNVIIYGGAATFSLTVRVMLSYANDAPGSYLDHLQFGAWR